MTNMFQKEERYIVIKLKDLSDEAEEALREHLQSWHVPTTESVVVEHDWPIYEQTWDAVQRLAENRPQRIEELEKHVEALQEKQVAETCACSQDAATDVCLGHSPVLKKVKAERNALAAPAVQGEPVGEAGSLPGAKGFTTAVFESRKVPEGTKLYTAPQPAEQHPAPSSGVPEGQAIGLLARVQGWWQNTDGDMPASLEQDISALLTAAPTAPAVQEEPEAEEVPLFECVNCNHLYQVQVTRCDCMPEEQKFNRWLARPERAARNYTRRIPGK